MTLLGPSWLLVIDAFAAMVCAVLWLGVWWALRAFPVPPLVDIQNRYRSPMQRNPDPIIVSVPDFWASSAFCATAAVSGRPYFPTFIVAPEPDGRLDLPV